MFGTFITISVMKALLIGIPGNVYYYKRLESAGLGHFFNFRGLNELL
jgi:hypothetical protein